MGFDDRYFLREDEVVVRNDPSRNIYIPDELMMAAWVSRRTDDAGVMATVEPPKFGAPRKGYGSICDAPGTYVLEP